MKAGPLRRVGAWLAGAWAGAMLGIGGVAAPTLFLLLPRSEAGRIAGAGLDVFADEPHVPAALLEREDVVLLPHVGSATVQTREAMARLVLDNVAAFVGKGELVTPVG